MGPIFLPFTLKSGSSSRLAGVRMRGEDRLTVPLFPYAALLVVFLLVVGPAAARAQSGGGGSGFIDISFHGASLDVYVQTGRDGDVSVDASLRKATGTSPGFALFSQTSLKSGKVELHLSEAGDNLIKARGSVEMSFAESSMSPTLEIAMAYLDNLSIEKINEKFVPKIRKIYSKLREEGGPLPGVGGRTAPGVTRLPRMRIFEITSFSWSSPEMEVSCEAILTHPAAWLFGLPINLSASAEERGEGFDLNVNLSATPDGPGLEDASFGLSASQEDNSTNLNLSAEAGGRMPVENGAYVVDLSRFVLGVDREGLSKLEEVKLPEDASATIAMEVPKNFHVENLPLPPSHCRTEKCEIRVWEGENAVRVATSLLSGGSGLTVKPGPREKPQEGVPRVYLVVAVAVGAAAAGGVVYWRRKSGSQEDGR